MGIASRREPPSPHCGGRRLGGLWLLSVLHIDEHAEACACVNIMYMGPVLLMRQTTDWSAWTHSVLGQACLYVDMATMGSTDVTCQCC